MLVARTPLRFVLTCSALAAVASSASGHRVQHANEAFELLSDGAYAHLRGEAGFGARIDAHGLSLAPLDDGAVWSLSLSTESVGRANATQFARAALPAACGGRIELDRGVALEWFESRPRGIEQLWSIPAAPPAGRSADELIVRVALDTELAPRLAADGRAIFFHDASGKPVLRYGGLAAFDATGRELGARLALALGALEVRIDDADAAYPLTIDPLITPATWTSESNQAGAQLGSSASTAGDVNGDGFSDLLVGASNYDNGSNADAGAVFLYYGSASGLAPSPSWTLLGTQATAGLGAAVSTAGDVDADGFDDFVVSEPRWDGGQVQEGRARLFLGSASGPIATAWAPESDQASAWFGQSLARAGDVNGDGFDDVIVGAHFYDAGSTDEGRAFVYLGTPSGLSPTPVWIQEPNQAGARFGSAVASAGDANADGYDDVIVGAPLYDNGTYADAGAIWVYLGGPFGPATSANYVGSVSQASARVGTSVGPAGDVNGDGFADVAFAAPLYDGGQTDEGLVWVKTGSSSGITGAGWSEQGDIASAQWGHSAMTAGDVNGDGFADLIASAPRYSAGQSIEGGVWLYNGSASGLPSGASQFVGEGNQVNANWGQLVGAAGDVNGDGFSDVFVAAPLFDQPESDEGRVWVFYGYADSVSGATLWSVEANSANAQYGEVVELAGDVDGDGFDDLLVAAGHYSGALASGGRAYLYRGKSGVPTTTPAWFVDAAQANEQLGANQGLASAGDVDGDGYADVLVGGLGFDNAFADAGRARLYRGGASGLATTPAWTFEGSAANQLVGGAVAGVGDVDGDGYADVLVGAQGFNGGVGRAYLFKGSPAGLAPSPFAVFDSPHATVSSPPGFGQNLAGAGDVDGDGFSDFLICAPHNGSGQRVHLYRGGPRKLATAPAWTYSNLEWGLQPHWSILGVGVGDANGDGFGDVVVGAELENFQAGHAYLFLGSAGGLSTTPAWQLTGAANARLGRGVARAGDINADGLPDFAVGAPFETGDQSAEGVLHVRFGSSATPGVAGVDRHSTLASAAFGWACAGDGDLDGDGYSDLVIGSPRVDNGSTDEGRAQISFGNAGRSRARKLQQRRWDDSAPIAVLGGTGPSKQMRLALDAFSAGGRDEVWLEWQLAPAALGFGAADLHASSAIDTGAPAGGQSAVRIDELADGFEGLVVHDWRVRVASRDPLFPRAPWLSLAKAVSGQGAVRPVR